MELRGLLFVCLVASAAAQTYKVCVPSNADSTCQSLEMGSSQATCERVPSRIDCALKLARGEVNIGYFSEEETLLLAHQNIDARVVASVRDVSRMEDFAFEAVAVVASTHTGGLSGLRGGYYCHPGIDSNDLRWSPRVLKGLELTAAETDRCSDPNVQGKTAEQIELETLSTFFSAACRPGIWSSNSTHDSFLKSNHPSMCALCGGAGSCEGYSIDMGPNVVGVNNNNRHIQTLECLRANTNETAPAVAYVAWLHVREYFTMRNPQDATRYGVLCPDGSVVPLTTEILNNAISPCAFVRQPWGTIVASTALAPNVLSNLQSWWPSGAPPSGGSWQLTLFNTLAGAGGANARVVFTSSPLPVQNYTSGIRQIQDVDSVAGCLPARRWCTLSTAEQAKCSWLRASAYVLGIEPRLSCLQRPNIFNCLRDIRDGSADFISSPSNYGYLARKHYNLNPVKMVQNQRAAAPRVVAYIKATSALSNITRFENLRGGRACFPEYGGLAYVAFVRAAQELKVLSDSECDYARAVGEFFADSCAPGAIDASHALSESTYDAANLCSVCRVASHVTGGNFSEPFCTWDFSNMYFGNNGSLACLADPTTDVAFINTQNITRDLAALNLQGSSFRALCRNNTLAATAGVAVDDGCALAHVVDAEVISRRDDPLDNSLNVLFDTLDFYFGYSAGGGNQLINLEVFSAFDGISDLLFKDSTIGFTEPSALSDHEPARNYIELFNHLDACSSASGTFSMMALVIMSLVAKFVIY